jgi:hypothetical protein
MCTVFFCLYVYFYLFVSVDAMCACQCLLGCGSVCLSVYIPDYECIWLSACIHAFFVSVRVCLRPSVCVQVFSLCVSLSLHVCVSVSGCVYASVCLCMCVHTYEFIQGLKILVHFTSQTKVLFTKHFSIKENVFITQSLQLLESAHYHHRRYIKYCSLHYTYNMHTINHLLLKIYCLTSLEKYRKRTWENVCVCV